MLDKCIALAVALSSGFLITEDLCVPPQYQGDTVAKVHFTNQKEITKHCGAPDDPSLIILGCVKDIGSHEMWIGNPCLDKEADIPMSYSHHLCHELAHMNGWTHPIAGKVRTPIRGSI
jgi:hypothetical protein